MCAGAVDVGDYVVVTNARAVQVTGKKAEQIVYRRHTGWKLKETSYRNMMEKKPEEVRFQVCKISVAYTFGAQIIRAAVSGMLPKNKLRDRRLQRLKIFTDEHNPYAGNILKLHDTPGANVEQIGLGLARQKLPTAAR